MNQEEIKNFSETFQWWLEYLNLQQNEFAALYGSSPQSINQLVKKEKVSKKVLSKVLTSLRLTSDEFWAREKSSKNKLSLHPTSEDSFDGVPIYDVEVYGGDVMNWEEATQATPIAIYRIPKYRGCIGVPYRGESMSGIFTPGEILILKPIVDRRLIEFGGVHVLDLLDGRRLVKYLRRDPHDIKNYLLRSHNPNYDDMNVPTSLVLRVFQVVGNIKDSAMYHSITA